jgi:hypothetical protein
VELSPAIFLSCPGTFLLHTCTSTAGPAGKTPAGTPFIKKNIFQVFRLVRTVKNIQIPLHFHWSGQQETLDPVKHAFLTLFIPAVFLLGVVMVDTKRCVILWRSAHGLRSPGSRHGYWQ